MNRLSTRTTAGKRAKGTLREYTEAILVAILLALFIRAFVVQAFKIPSGSMKSTLLVGDHILVSKFAYGVKIPMLDITVSEFDPPQRHDIVVFEYPLDPSKDFIKRVIGLPGDTLEIRNKRVFVNGKLLEEPYVQFTDNQVLPASVSPRDNLEPILVPERSLFVMGDNRDESYDSRFWKFIDFSAVKGKALIIYWSWNKNGRFTFDPQTGYIRWDRIGRLIR